MTQTGPWSGLTVLSTVPLADLLEHGPGSIRIGPFGSALKKHEYSNSGIRVLGIDDVLAQGRPRVRKFIPPAKYRELAQYTVKPGDVLVTNMGTVGRAWLVPETFEAAIISSHLIKLTPNRRLVDPHFLEWVINAAPGVVAQVAAESRGAIMPGFNTTLLKQLRIPLSPLSDQRRIAGILDRASDLLTARRKSLVLAHALSRSTFVNMFGDPMSNPLRWTRQPLGTLITRGPQNGLYKPASYYGSGTPILRIDGFYDGVMARLGTFKRVRITSNEVNIFGLEEGDIVINRVNSREFVGKSAIIPRLSEPVVFESNMMRLTVDRNAVIPEYVVAFLQTDFFWSQVRRARKDAVNQSSINQKDVQAFLINVPPIALQYEFAGRQSSLETLLAAFEDSASLLRALITSVTHQVFGNSA